MDVSLKHKTTVIFVVSNRFISPLGFSKGIVLCFFDLWVKSCYGIWNPKIGKYRVQKAIFGLGQIGVSRQNELFLVI